MENLISQIESLLFISIKPISVKQLAKILNADSKKVKGALKELFEIYVERKSGIHIQKIGLKYQMVSASENAKIIKEFLKDETTGDLTPASLETLTVIAYRGPVTKTELELIRGVNCTLILRNLLIRGLIQELKPHKNDEIDENGERPPRYQVSFDFLQFLGIDSPQNLPKYEELNSNEHLQNVLNPKEPSNT